MKTSIDILQNFIVFEGLDGAGTTTQTKLLVNSLNQGGYPASATCEPTDSRIGVLIRDVLSGVYPVPPRSLALLFAADREQHLWMEVTGIVPMLAAGKRVVSDRYFFSSLAYQTIATSYAEVAAFNAYFPYPQIVIYIDTPPEVCIERMQDRKKLDEFERLDFQKNVYASYERAFAEIPEGTVLLRYNGQLAIERLAAVILSDVLQIISMESP